MYESQEEEDKDYIAEVEYCLDGIIPEEVMLVDLLRKLKIQAEDIEDYSLSFSPGERTEDYDYFVITCSKTTASQSDSHESSPYGVSLSLYQDRVSELTSSEQDDTTLGNQLQLIFSND